MEKIKIWKNKIKSHKSPQYLSQLGLQFFPQYPTNHHSLISTLPLKLDHRY